MKNPSFGALHSPLPSQSKMQGRKSEEEIQQLAVSHGYAKFRTPCQISHGMRNLPVHQLR